MRAATLLGAIVCAAAAGCGGESTDASDGDRIARAILPSLQTQLADDQVAVIDVTCEDPSATAATRCSARIRLEEEETSIDEGPTRRLGITVRHVGGRSTWQADRLPRFTAEGGPPGTEGIDPIYAWTRVTCRQFDARAATWFDQAALVLGDEISRASPGVSRSVARRSVWREITRACLRAKNRDYAPGAGAHERAVARLG